MSKRLEKWLGQRNKFRSIFGSKPLPMPTTPEECKPLFDILAGELSPENLCCDGELPRNQVIKKKRELDGAWADLEKIYGGSVSEDDVYRWWRETNAA